MSCNYKKISTLLGFQDVVDVRRVLSRPDFSTVIILFLIYKKQTKQKTTKTPKDLQRTGGGTAEVAC